MNAVANIEKGQSLAVMGERELMTVLKSSLYPGAADESVKMVLAYCQAAKLDPMQKPVHIVPMWDSKAGGMRDVVMPGIGLYRTQAARSGEYAGVSEPEYGPDLNETIGGVAITYPAWCRVTVKRKLSDGSVADFTAVERWKENYAMKGGKEKSIAPNAMWTKRPYGQIAKCAEAQALRKAFPEFGAQPTADEMEGKTLDERDMGKADVVDELITLEQAADLQVMIANVTPNPEAAKMYDEKLCAFLKVDSLENIPASKYANAVAQIDARRKKIAESKKEESHGD